MGKSKYYVVWKGHQPGIFSNWDDCRKQTENYVGALYKSFESRLEAEKALKEKPYKHFKKKVSAISVGAPMAASISVDAACSGNPGPMEYQGVETHSKKRIFHQGPFPMGTNNIGEFLAIVHALALSKKHGIDMPVYTDSLTAIKWVKDKKVKTKLVEVQENRELFELIDRAILWLTSNTYKNPILKWDTKAWGEIPADFGRK